MTEIRLFLPENKGAPVLMEHEDLVDSRGIIVDLKFDNFEIHYGVESDIGLHECEECGGDTVGIPRLIVKDGINKVFDMDFNKHWLLNLEIKRLAPKKDRLFEIYFWITNMDDGDTCEVCENNRFYYNHRAVVNNYSIYYYSPPKGEFMKHQPDPKEPIDDSVLEELK